MKATNRTSTAARRLLLAAWCWQLAALPPLAAMAQCTDQSCQVAVEPHPAVVRVVGTSQTGSRCYGSGTLVQSDQEQRVVLTCAHLFSREADAVEVIFPDGRRLPSSVLSLDRTWDLAALEVDRSSVKAVSIADDHPNPGDQLQSCGYGTDGRYWCNRGRALGYAKTAGTSSYETLELDGCARDGDSGGPVFNQRGELVAVLWGTDGRTVDGTYCGRIRKFLARILGVGRSPQRPPGLVPPSPSDTSPDETSPPFDVDQLNAIRRRLEALTEDVADADRKRNDDLQAGNLRIGKLEKAVSLVASLKNRVDQAEAAVGRDSLRELIRETAVGVISDRPPGAFGTLLPAVLTALGWTAPPSIAAIFAIRLLGSVLRRKAARRRRRPPADNKRQSKRSKPLNDEYAEQLAQVYALSGRSPIADATLGREFDEELRRAEQSSDNTLSRWARNLRERVAKRFYRIHDHSPLPAEPPSGR